MGAKQTKEGCIVSKQKAQSMEHETKECEASNGVH
jgi:hypothetical protein